VPPSIFEPYLQAHRRRRELAVEQAQRRADEAMGAARAAARALAERLGATRVVLFGSLARGTYRESSDIDLAVEGLPPSSLVDAMMAASNAARPFEVSVVPAERADDFARRDIERDGVVLWPP